ncbi:CsgG/HfaB family protein [Desulfobotulus alkaliphilus]|nr:CsgG/HfaB family protein [Desulfobotulus alkaliphilus]
MSLATLGYETPSGKILRQLPEPKGKITVAVYNFRDQTGQYKHHPTTSSFSTAVTQGATTMMVESLLASGWFVPVEREGLNDLLTERKIIRANIANPGSGNDIPNLLHAPLILEGGIVAYETNVSTGGMGAKYFGVGGSTQYRKDQVTLYLRAVDVMQGKILHSVSTSKSILSMEVMAGIFRYVDYRKLLEAEAGYTTNEPPQLCVLEAIEKALLAMIVDGIISGLWELKNYEDINNPIIYNYLREKYGRKEARATIARYKQRYIIKMDVKG